MLGNKCDMEDRRLVSKERGTQVHVPKLIITLSVRLGFIALVEVGEEGGQEHHASPHIRH